MNITYDAIYKIAYKQCDELKYLPNNLIIGYVAYVLEVIPIKERINPVPIEWIDAINDALHDNFFGGCEPEFETKEAYDRYNDNIKRLYHIEWHIDDPKLPLYERFCPYIDKTIPYIRYKKQ